MFHKSITIRRLLPATAIVLACAATAPAADAMTISLGAPSLTGRVAITEPVTVTCSAFDPSLTLVSENIFLQVEQAAGRAIAHGSAVSGGFVPSLLFPCDGSQMADSGPTPLLMH
jgi:ABC-type enterobactin transport system permease subunit